MGGLVKEEGEGARKAGKGTKKTPARRLWECYVMSIPPAPRGAS